MNDKIHIVHPKGKNAVKIDAGKYEVMKKAILKSLEKSELTHTELLDSVNKIFNKSKTKFDGSVGWYMEWVKLDLEATKVIQRLSEKTPHKWKVS